MSVSQIRIKTVLSQRSVSDWETQTISKPQIKNSSIPFSIVHCETTLQLHLVTLEETTSITKPSPKSHCELGSVGNSATGELQNIESCTHGGAEGLDPCVAQRMKDPGEHQEPWHPTAQN